MTHDNDELGVRLDLAMIGFKEVLDATKHHDDKIGRFLTSIAFLTTGAIAFGFGIKGDLLYLNYKIGTRSVPLPGIFLLLFLIFVILTVVVLICAMGPTLRIPGSSPPSPSSNLYFIPIATTDETVWMDQWGLHGSQEIEHLRGLTRDNLLRETHNIAVRVTFKYERMREARSLFIIALMFLAEAFFLMMYAPLAGFATKLQPYGIPWDWTPKIVIGLITAVFTLMLCYDIYRYDQAFHYRDENWSSRRGNLRRLLTFIPIIPLLLSSAPANHHDSYSTALLLIAVALLVGFSLVSIRSIYRNTQGQTEAKTQHNLGVLTRTSWIAAIFFSVVLIVLTLLFHSAGLQLTLIAYCSAPIIILQLLNFRRTTFVKDKVDKPASGVLEKGELAPT